MNLHQATNIAIETAKQSTEKHRVGCIIFDRKNYVSAHNRTFSVKVANKSTPYSEHAEATTINRAIHSKINIERSTLIVVRLNTKNNLMLAKPCFACTSLIKSVGIPKIYYSNDPLHREQIPKNFKSLGNL